MVAQQRQSAQEPSLSPAEPWVLVSQRFVGTCSKVLAKGRRAGRYWNRDNCAGLYVARTTAMRGAHELALHRSSVVSEDAEES